MAECPQSVDRAPPPCRRCHLPCAPLTSSPPWRRPDRRPLRLLVLASVSGTALRSISLSLWVGCRIGTTLSLGGLRLGPCHSFILHRATLVGSALDVILSHARHILVEQCRVDLELVGQLA